jgi:hypothetical protein
MIWGSNAYGQLGNGGVGTESSLPLQPTGLCQMESVTVNEIAEKNAIAVYPNPTTGIIFLSENYSVTLIDLTGKIILQKQNTNNLDISNQATGFYFLLLSDDKGEFIQQSKIIKE